MRRLMLLRHAKSDRSPGLEDHQRPLNARGREAAPLVGAYVKEHRLFPALVVCSTAVRTRQTWDLMAPSLPTSTRVHFEDALYLAEQDQILEVVRALPAAAESVMLIGHNPGLHEAALALAGSGDAALRRQLHAKFPTAALAVIDFPGDDWASVHDGGGRLERYFTPRSIDSD